MTKPVEVEKTYQTRSGLRVINLKNVPYNSAGRLVTYPIKGTVIVREKPLKTEYRIWSSRGVSDVVFGRYSEMDLVEVK